MNVLQLIHTLYPLNDIDKQVLPHQVTLSLWEGEMIINVMFYEVMYSAPTAVVLVESSNGVEVFKKESGATVDRDIWRQMTFQLLRWVAQRIAENAIGAHSMCNVKVTSIQRFNPALCKSVTEYPTDLGAILA